MRNAYKILFEKPEVKRPLERHSRRWEVNVKLSQQEDVSVLNPSSPVTSSCEHDNGSCIPHQSSAFLKTDGMIIVLEVNDDRYFQNLIYS